MGGLGDLISALINIVTGIVDGYLSNAAGIAGFNKEGEIQNEVISNYQQSYSNLEDKIGAAYIQQQADAATADAKKKVVAGNIISVIGAVLMVLLILAVLYFIARKK